jgi:Icc-related predicted phosphoesterase
MYIKLTNANPQHRGNPIAINSDQIVTLHSSIVTREDEMLETVTFVFCPPHGTWEVSENFDSVVDMLNSQA